MFGILFFVLGQTVPRCDASSRRTHSAAALIPPNRLTHDDHQARPHVPYYTAAEPRQTSSLRYPATIAAAGSDEDFVGSPSAADDLGELSRLVLLLGASSAPEKSRDWTEFDDVAPLAAVLASTSYETRPEMKDDDDDEFDRRSIRRGKRTRCETKKYPKIIIC